MNQPLMFMIGMENSGENWILYAAITRNLL